jgi:hypothetical protein
VPDARRGACSGRLRWAGRGAASPPIEAPPADGRRARGRDPEPSGGVAVSGPRARSRGAQRRGHSSSSCAASALGLVVLVGGRLVKPSRMRGSSRRRWKGATLGPPSLAAFPPPNAHMKRPVKLRFLLGLVIDLVVGFCWWLVPLFGGGWYPRRSRSLLGGHPTRKAHRRLWRLGVWCAWRGLAGRARCRGRPSPARSSCRRGRRGSRVQGRPQAVAQRCEAALRLEGRPRRLPGATGLATPRTPHPAVVGVGGGGGAPGRGRGLRHCQAHIRVSGSQVGCSQDGAPHLQRASARSKHSRGSFLPRRGPAAHRRSGGLGCQLVISAHTNPASSRAVATTATPAGRPRPITFR